MISDRVASFRKTSRPSSRLEIERQAALVAIDGRLRKSDLLLVAGQRRRYPPRDFTFASFDFDNVGA